jgi:hypothetical protein
MTPHILPATMNASIEPIAHKGGSEGKLAAGTRAQKRRANSQRELEACGKAQRGQRYTPAHHHGKALPEPAAKATTVRKGHGHRSELDNFSNASQLLSLQCAVKKKKSIPDRTWRLHADKADKSFSCLSP